MNRQSIASIQPLGDQGALVTCADEGAAGRFAGAVRQHSLSGLVDVVQAYTAVAVFFDLEHTCFSTVHDVLQSIAAGGAAIDTSPEGKLHVIPCCYELQHDLERVAAHAGLSASDVIRLHSQTEYTIYAIGFCPGFPYLGYLPPALCGVPRLAAPRLRVEPGSVGLTGRQTGIYTEARPGGWNLIGRTPLELVNVADGYFPLRTGERVRFTAIDRADFHRLLGKRLA